MATFNVICLGSQDMTPVRGNDCSNYLINEQILVDCGTSPVMNLLNAGVDIGKIRHIVLTHLHPDHCVGLASLLYYLASVANVKMPNVTVYGPKGEITELIDSAYDYIVHFNREKPSVMELEGGENIALDTAEGQITLSTIAAHHSVPGLCLKFTAEDKSLGFSGDTSYFPILDDFFSGCNVLVHECSFAQNDSSNTKIDCGHSDPSDVATVAKAADVAKVYLTHAKCEHDARLNSFKKYSDIPVEFFESGYKIEI